MTLKERTSRILCLGLVAAAPLLATENAFADTISAPAKSETVAVDDNDKARALYQKASDAFEAGKTEEAHQLLLEAWAIRETYDVALVLGQVELKLKHYRDAAEHLAFCLSHFGPSDKQETLERVRKGFAESKAHVAAVKVSTDRDGADIFVDTLRVGSAPLPSVIFVDPGPRTLTARLNGETAEQALPAEAGKDYQAQLMFGARSTMTTVPPVSSGLGAPHGAVPPDNTPKGGQGRSIVPLVVGSVVAAAGLGMFIGFRVSASSDRDTIDGFSKKLGSQSACTTGTPHASDCAALHDTLQSYDRKRDWSTAGLAIAATSVVATAAFYVFWPTQSKDGNASTTSTLRFGGNLGSGTAGVSVAGAF